VDAEKHVVAIVTFDITAAELDRVSSEVRTAFQSRLPSIPGFVEGMLLVNEETTQVRVVTEWRSKEDWALAEWDETIQRTVAKLFEDTGSYRLEIYFQVVKATAPPDSSG
jgi:heme-degrading monooxygenase HmoA